MSIAGRSEALRLFLPRPQVVLLALLLAALVAGAGVPEARRRRRADRKGEADGRRRGDSGQAAVRREGLVVGLREGRATRYQWFRCDQMGAHCALASRRHEEEPSARRERRRPHARPRGPRNGLARVDDGGLEPDRADRRRSAAARLDRPADDLGRGRAGKHAQGRARHVEPGAGVVQLPVGPLQQARDARAPRSKGATAETHEVGAGDLGHALVAIVQARSGATSQAVFSVATAPPPSRAPRHRCAGPSELCAAAGRRRRSSRAGS